VISLQILLRDPGWQQNIQLLPALRLPFEEVLVETLDQAGFKTLVTAQEGYAA